MDRRLKLRRNQRRSGQISNFWSTCSRPWRNLTLQQPSAYSKKLQTISRKTDNIFTWSRLCSWWVYAWQCFQMHSTIWFKVMKGKWRRCHLWWQWIAWCVKLLRWIRKVRLTPYLSIQRFTTVPLCITNDLLIQSKLVKSSCRSWI